MMVARVDGWRILSHRRRSDRYWRQCLRMGSHYDLWSWSMMIVRTLSLTLTLCNYRDDCFWDSNIFQSSGVFIQTYKIPSNMICEYLWWIIELDWICLDEIEIDHISGTHAMTFARCLFSLIKSLMRRHSSGGVGQKEEVLKKTILCIYAILDYPPENQPYPTLGRGNSKVPWDVEGKRLWSCGQCCWKGGQPKL